MDGWQKICDIRDLGEGEAYKRLGATIRPIIIRTIHSNINHPLVGKTSARLGYLESPPVMHQLQSGNMILRFFRRVTSTSETTMIWSSTIRDARTPTRNQSRTNSNQRRTPIWRVSTYITLAGLSVNGKRMVWIRNRKKEKKVHLKSRQPDDSHPSRMIHNTNFESPFPS